MLMHMVFRSPVVHPGRWTAESADICGTFELSKGKVILRPRAVRCNVFRMLLCTWQGPRCTFGFRRRHLNICALQLIVCTVRL